jgi:hypothetical protein
MSATGMIHQSEYKPVVSSQMVLACAESFSLPGVMNGKNVEWRASVVWGGKLAVSVSAGLKPARAVWMASGRGEA